MDEECFGELIVMVMMSEVVEAWRSMVAIA